LQKDFYTVKDIADIIQIKEKSVRNLITSGQLQASKICNKWVITAENLKKLVDDKEALIG
jgi:hypothetical protein